jgi:diacylglycerol kinase (ATP)
MKSRSVFDSFKFAMEGLVYAIRSQRHMTYLLLLAAAVLLASQLLGVDRTGLIALVFAIGLLLSAELINAAIEAVVDLACDSYHPLAKAAKDVAGAAVLVSSAIAVIIGAVVFLDSGKLSRWLKMGLPPVDSGPKPLHIAIVGATLVCILVVLGKVWGKKGTLWKGGAVSGHSALAAYLFTAITYKSNNNTLIIAMALALAFLVAQSRLEGGIHTLRELLLGALLGLAVSSAMLHFLV